MAFKCAVISLKITFGVVSNKNIVRRMSIRKPALDHLPDRRCNAESVPIHLFVYIYCYCFHSSVICRHKGTKGISSFHPSSVPHSIPLPTSLHLLRWSMSL